MMRRLLFVVLLIAPLAVAAQFPCGTVVHVGELHEMSFKTTVSPPQDSIAAVIPLKIHIVRHSDGSGGLDTALLTWIRDTLNGLYKAAGIAFAYCGDPEFIDDDKLVRFESTTEEDVIKAHDTPRVFNLYFIDSLEINGNPVCGWAYMATLTAPTRGFIRTVCADKGNTVAHEIGHMFSLIHTHGSGGQGDLTDELVDGSNCSTAGDLVCDTPADPDLTDKTGPQCNYTGTVTDANGDTFDPLMNNIMSYANYNYCVLDSFTPGQYERIYNSLFYHNRISLMCPANSGQENALLYVSPNPFTGHLVVRYRLSASSQVNIDLYDVIGRRVRKLYNGTQEPGELRLRHTLGEAHLAAGYYILKLSVDEQVTGTAKLFHLPY